MIKEEIIRAIIEVAVYYESVEDGDYWVEGYALDMADKILKVLDK